MLLLQQFRSFNNSYSPFTMSSFHLLQNFKILHSLSGQRILTRLFFNLPTVPGGFALPFGKPNESTRIDLHQRAILGYNHVII